MGWKRLYCRILSLIHKLNSHSANGFKLDVLRKTRNRSGNRRHCGLMVNAPADNIATSSVPWLQTMQCLYVFLFPCVWKNNVIFPFPSLFYDNPPSKVFLVFYSVHFSKSVACRPALKLELLRRWLGNVFQFVYLLFRTPGWSIWKQFPLPCSCLFVHFIN